MQINLGKLKRAIFCLPESLCPRPIHDASLGVSSALDQEHNKRIQSNGHNATVFIGEIAFFDAED